MQQEVKTKSTIVRRAASHSERKTPSKKKPRKQVEVNNVTAASDVTLTENAEEQEVDPVRFVRSLIAEDTSREDIDASNLGFVVVGLYMILANFFLDFVTHLRSIDVTAGLLLLHRCRHCC